MKVALSYNLVARILVLILYYPRINSISKFLLQDPFELLLGASQWQPVK